MHGGLSPEPVLGAAELPYDIGQLVHEPVYPTLHRHETRIILGICIVRRYNAVQDSTDDFCFIVLVRQNAVREFIVVMLAFAATKPADLKPDLLAALPPQDPPPTISIAKIPAAGWTNRWYCTALNEKY